MASMAAVVLTTPVSEPVSNVYQALSGDVLHVYVPAFVALVVLWIAIRLGLRWLRKASWVAAGFSMGPDGDYEDDYEDGSDEDPWKDFR